MKVYCMDCEYFTTPSDRAFDMASEAYCICKNNISRKKHDSWLQPWASEDYIKHPSVINDKNNCKWYKQRNKED